MFEHNRAPCRSRATRRAGHAVRDLIERNRARPVARPRRPSAGWSRPVRRALLCRPWRVPRGAPSACPLRSRQAQPCAVLLDRQRAADHAQPCAARRPVRCRSRRASRPAFAPGQRAAGHAVRLSAADLDGQPRNQGASRPPVTPSACPLRSRRAQPCAACGVSAPSVTPSACALPMVAPSRQAQAVRRSLLGNAPPVTPCACLDGKPSATGKAREPLPFARRRVRCRPSRQAQPCAVRFDVRGVRVRAPCAACSASSPSVRRMVAACAPCAPVPSVACPVRCAVRHAVGLSTGKAREPRGASVAG